MGNYISMESSDINDNFGKELEIKSDTEIKLDTEIKSDIELKSDTKICDCGEFAPHIQGGSCRHCYGFLK